MLLVMDPLTDEETLYVVGARNNFTSSEMRTEVYDHISKTFSLFPGLDLPIGLSKATILQVAADTVFLAFGNAIGSTVSNVNCSEYI